MTTRKTTDLFVTTNNELGTLSRLTNYLKMNNINVESFVAWEEGKNAHFRFVTSDNKRARELWTKEGYTVKEDPVVMWTTSNTPGRLYAGCTAIAEAKINTFCNYASTPTTGTGTGTGTGTNTCTVVFYTNNPDRTYDVLNKIG